MGSNIILCLERHNDALVRFEDGPPFTLQRLCEILLDPKGTYTKLSKLALALDKEEQQSQKHTGAVDVEPERLPEHPAAVPNGTEHVGGDCDEEKADAEAVVSGRRDVEMQEDKPDQISNVSSDANSGGAVTSEAVNVREKSSDPQS